MSKSKKTERPAGKQRRPKRSREVTRIHVGGRTYQPTLFPIVLRPDAEVRAEQEREVLLNRVPAGVMNDLTRQAKEILERVQQWEMDHFEKPHRYSWGPGHKDFYTAEQSVLSELVKNIAEAAFKVAAKRYRAEIESLIARLDKQTRLLEQRREGGEILAAEGREKRKVKTDARTTRLCKLYKRLRSQHPAGRQGNGLTLSEVAREFGSLPDKHKPITVQAIRKALKRGGIDCR
jgi:hypothetical protein